MNKRCWAEIDLEAIRANARYLRRCAGSQLMAVVKANAYGHGLVPVAQALVSEVGMFAVANVTEALALKAAGIATPIFILAPALEEERRHIVAEGFIPSISSYEEAAAYDRLADGRSVQGHLVIDTGMGRIGIWQDDAVAETRRILSLPHLQITAVATHLPSSDEDPEFTRAQLLGFERLLQELRQAGLKTEAAHVLNSAGILHFSGHAHSYVRAGLALYGISPFAETQSALQPALSFKTSVTLVRELGPGRTINYGRTFTTPGPMRVATLAVGYADGYQRHLSNRGAQVLIGGTRCNVLGRVTMDQICVDVSHLPPVQTGEQAVLIGQQGSQTILASELASKAGTIAWEIFTGIGTRVERIYHA